MPLSLGKSKKAFSHNVKVEMEHGKPQKQAVAIAFSEKRKAAEKKHKADGGCVGEGCEHHSHYYDEGSDSTVSKADGKDQGHDIPSNVNAPSSLSNAWDRVKAGLTDTSPVTAPRPAGMAKGGEVEPEMEGEDEMHEAIAGELCDALEKKDKKGIMESMRAIVMACGGKV